MKFFASAIAVALCVALVSADIATVKEDLKAIDAGVNGLSDAFPDDSSRINYFSALAIHNKAGEIDNVVKKSTEDVNDLTEEIDEADSKEALASLTKTEATIAIAIQKLIAAKPKFDKLGVTALGKKDISDLSTDGKAFAAALLAKAPASQKAEAQALVAKLNADLDAGTAAFA